MKEAALRVAEALRTAGVTAEVVEFAESTRTAAAAAAAVGATVGQIVKSLVFLADGRPILALVSGENRVDLEKMARIAGGAITRADATAVRAATGYAIGGVPPIAHTTSLPVYLDQDLMRYDVVWAAAGTPNAVFKIAPTALRDLTGAPLVDLAAASS